MTRNQKQLHSARFTVMLTLVCFCLLYSLGAAEIDLTPSKGTDTYTLKDIEGKVAGRKWLQLEVKLDSDTLKIYLLPKDEKMEVIPGLLGSCFGQPGDRKYAGSYALLSIVHGKVSGKMELSAAHFLEPSKGNIYDGLAEFPIPESTHVKYHRR